MTAQLVVATTEEKQTKAAADLFVSTAKAAVKKDGRFVVAISGGDTPIRLFDLLASDYFKSRVPWLDTYLFWVDERCVPQNHPSSNYGMAKSHLLSKVPIPSTHIFPIPGEMKPPEIAAKAYQSTLKCFFKLDLSLPKFHMILLGMGEDGHTASLFLGTTGLVEKERWVTTNYIQKLYSYRLTMTFPIINAAERIAILCAGENKATVLRDIFRFDTPANRYPIQYVNPSSDDLTWFLDSKAASKLPPDVLGKARIV